jgi:sugar (pentulose or hexulose) kinase
LGLTDAGEFWLASGTAWVINGVSAIADIANLPAAMSLNFHVLPGRWTMSQFLGGLGAGMEWLLANCLKDAVGTQIPTRQQQLQSLNNALNETKPGSAGLLAFPISGANHEDVIMPGGFYGLRLDHTVADMSRAVMEGAAFELRWALDDLQQTGFSVDQLWMVGGAVHSPHWPQILADVSGIPVFLCQYHHGPALGAAMLALKGLGLVDEFPDWVSARKVDVNRDHGSLYKERLAVYQQVALGRTA